MQTLAQDLRYAIRILKSQPAVSLMAIIALALGIGANTAIFSVINAVLLRPLPCPEPDRLVIVQQSLPKLGLNLASVSGAEFVDYTEGNEAFSAVAGYTDISLNLTGHGEAARIQASRVSASLFPMLGVSPLRGRLFSEEEDQPGKDNVALISRALWQNHFGASADITGKTIRLDEKPYTIIGVMPSSIRFLHIQSSFDEATDLWIPFAMTDAEKQRRADSYDYGIIGRLKPGVTLAEAQANIESIAERFQQQHPDFYKSNNDVTASLIKLEERLVKRVRPFLLVLLAAVGFVLMIACANVANLLLARAAARQKEIAIRAAMGASLARVARQLLTESVLLALAGGLVGLLAASWVIDLLARFGPTDVPRLDEASLDPAVLGFTLLVSMLTGIAFGLAPAFQIRRVDLNEALKESSTRTSRGREGKRLRSLLVVFEIASAMVLLTGAGLLIHSFIRLLRVPPGFNPEGVVIAQTTLPRARYPEPRQSKAAHREVLERIAALPGVKEVGAASTLPLVEDWTIGFIIDGSPDSINIANGAIVSDGYFRAMGIELKRGRTFTAEDREGATAVIAINETMARALWPDGDALGKRIMWGGWRDAWLTVVGVVADVKISSLEAETKPTIYMPMFQYPRSRPNVIYVARTTGDTSSLASAMRGEIRKVDSELPVYDIRSMQEIIRESVSQRRFLMMLLGVFASAAMLLAMVGIYGVMSYSVTERTREISVRMALGASYRDVLKMVVGQGMALAVAGVGAGLAAALALTRLMKTLLFGVSATDPMTFAGVAALLILTALFACYLPARRAARVDPITALRYE
ncbi:MAG: ABC transporter permease [Acidobacteriota bacterium]